MLCRAQSLLPVHGRFTETGQEQPRHTADNADGNSWAADPDLAANAWATSGDHDTPKLPAVATTRPGAGTVRKRRPTCSWTARGTTPTAISSQQLDDFRSKMQETLKVMNGTPTALEHVGLDIQIVIRHENIIKTGRHDEYARLHPVRRVPCHAECGRLPPE